MTSAPRLTLLEAKTAPSAGVSDEQLNHWAGSKTPTIRALVAEVRRQAALLEAITVCASCHRRSCWEDYARCDGYQFSGTIDIPVVALQAMGLEDPEWWVE